MIEYIFGRCEFITNESYVEEKHDYLEDKESDAEVVETFYRFIAVFYSAHHFYNI